MRIDCYVTLGNERETIYDVETLVRDLDRAGVDKAVIAPWDRAIAVDNREGNDFMIAQWRKFPSRIIPCCTVNPWYGERGLAELDRAVSAGARMLMLNPTIQGFLMNDELMDPLLDGVSEKKLPVYVHTGPHLYGAPWQVVQCALRYPDIPFILGHAGATDYWNDIPYAGAHATNVYLEGSFARPFIFKAHLQTIGAEKGIMGSSAPRNDLVFEWEQYTTELNDDVFEPVFGDNLACLLGEMEVAE